MRGSLDKKDIRDRLYTSSCCFVDSIRLSVSAMPPMVEYNFLLSQLCVFFAVPLGICERAKSGESTKMLTMQQWTRHSLLSKRRTH